MVPAKRTADFAWEKIILSKLRGYGGLGGSFVHPDTMLTIMIEDRFPGKCCPTLGICPAPSSICLSSLRGETPEFDCQSFLRDEA